MSRASRKMPEPTTLAEHIVDALARQGVERIFGIPGGGSSLALIDAAADAGVDFVLTRTEAAAAIMAAVTGELTGIPGVVLTGVGPGAASAVNGIAYASLERAPLILLTDGPASSLHQAFDQQALFAPITKMQCRLRPESGRADVAACIAATLTPPWGPVHVELTAADAVAPVTGRAVPAPADPTPTPDAAALDRASRMLDASRRPMVLAGLEARYGEGPAALRRFAEALACPVLLTYKAKGVLPDRHPNMIGLVAGAAAETAAVGRADLMVRFGFDPVELIAGAWRLDTPVLDLSPAAADALSPVDGASDWTAAEITALRDGLRDRQSLAGAGHTAQTVVEALSAAAPAGCRVTVDAGAHMFSTLACWPAEEPFGVLKSSGLSTMGFALPAAIASALQAPARPVAAITGDGGLMMCLPELATAVERGCPLVVVALNDAALSLIDIKQQQQQRPSRGVRTPRVDIAAAARALGCRAWRVAPDEPLAPIFKDAFTGDGPALIDVTVDPSGYVDQLTAIRG